ncbi:hypothetical protein [Sphingosinicella sp. BN140058]|uniref:hypothetical protein n=1 Tax=Sphingosinicella sp. BN140058 TaxID=1892855 RepID=UPI001010B0EE|nr:hypothetical protein [Sphingosinicella sp. BN140058]QAY75268.1 hypothetical protein ETR14_01020 [Sphingosinicella sp. BN140058]
MAASAPKIIIALDGRLTSDDRGAHLRALGLGRGKTRELAKRAIAAQPGKISDQIPHRRTPSPEVAALARPSAAAGLRPATGRTVKMVGALGANSSKAQMIAAYKAAAAAASTTRTLTGNVVSFEAATSLALRSSAARRAA